MKMLDLQDAVLALMLRSSEFTDFVSKRVPLDDVFFDKFKKKIACDICSFKLKYGRCSFDDLQLRWKETESDESVSLLEQYLDRLKGLDVSKDYVLDRLDDFVKRQVFSSAILQAQEALKNEDVNRIQKIFETSIEKVFRYEGKIESVLDEAFFEEVFRKEVSDSEFLMTTGFSDLDKYAHLRRGSLWVWLGLYSTGKTWALIYLFREALLQGVIPLFITLEMTKKEIATRFYMSLAGVSLNGQKETYVLTEDFSDVESFIPNSIFDKRDEIKKLLQFCKGFGDALIYDGTADRLTPSGIRSLLEEFKIRYKYYPDMLLIDTPDLMSADKRFSEPRLESIEIYKQLKLIALKYKIAVVVVSQANRSAEGKLWVTGKETAEDISKMQRADVGISISQTPLENELKIARLMIVRNRIGEKLKKFVLRQNYSIGQFLISGREMSPDEPIPCIPETTKRLVLDKIYSFLDMKLRKEDGNEEIPEF